MSHIVILGAGISGLSLGWFLKQRFGDSLKLTLLEKSHRSGGWIQTITKDGFLFDRGPRSCRSYGSGLATLELIEQLGIQNEVITPSPAAHKRYIWEKGQLHQLPTGLFSLLMSPFFKDVFQGVLRDLRAPAIQSEDISIFDFVSHRFGRPIAERLFDPLTTGIYAGNIHALSMRSCFSFLFEAEKRAGSVLWGMLKQTSSQKKRKSAFIKEIQKSSLFSFKEGMQTLTDRLATALAPSIIYDSTIESLSFSNKKAYIGLKSGEEIVADHVYSTLPAHTLIGLLPDPLIQNLLKQIPEKSVSAIHLGYSMPVLNQKGFGYLIPSKEKASILGVVWDSCVFPQQNQEPGQTRLTVMLGEILEEKLLVTTALKEIENHLEIKATPSTIETTLAKKAIPQYLVGHNSRIQQLEKQIHTAYPQLTLHGSSFHGVSVNDCIANSQCLAESL